MGEFGENLKIFSDNIADVDFTKISSAITNLNRLVTVLKSLNAEDVRIGALTELGYALNSFDANSSFFDLFDGAFDKMEEAGKTFIQKFIDGVVSKATEMTDTANQTVTKFTGDITTAIQSSVPLVTIEIDNMMIAVESAITNHEPTVTEAFNSLLTAIINTFKTRQPEFTNEGSANAKSYADGVSGSEAPDIALQSMTEDSIRIIHEKGPAFIDAGTQTAESIGTGISQNTSTVDAVNATMNTSLQSIQNRQGDFYSSGVGSATNVSNGFASKQGASVGTVENLITACVSKINAMRTDFLTAGTYAIGGFIEGFTSKIQSAAESAANLARSALNAAKSALDINSPSKEFAWLGEMSGEGYIQAMHKMVSKVSQSGTELGNTAVNSTTLALESLMDLVNNGIDTTPTIRPVIDLSDVESGVTALNGLMTAPRTLSLAGSINRVNAVSNSMDASRSDYASSNQNGGKAVEYGPMTINVYGAVGQDVNELANMVMEKVQHKVERTGAMWE
nr:MAG TPA: tail tape measure protein [Caudoviricetes sp.]